MKKTSQRKLEKIDWNHICIPLKPRMPPKGICIICFMRYGRYKPTKNCSDHSNYQRRKYKQIITSKQKEHHAKENKD